MDRSSRAGRYGVLAVVAVVACVMAGVGYVARSRPAAAGAQEPYVTTRLADVRGLCVRVGDGEPRSLWLDADTGRCPISPTVRWWGPTTLRAAFGDYAVDGGELPRPSGGSSVPDDPDSSRDGGDTADDPGTDPEAPVTAGAFCHPAGDVAHTATGKVVTCKVTSSDTRLRWRS